MITYQRDLPVKYTTDVLVVGGGPAGIAAAVACAAQGKHVFLAEGNGSFGGSGTTGLVPSFCQFTDGLNNLTGRFGREIHHHLFGKNFDYRRGFYSFSVEKLKRLYDRLLTQAGVQFSLFTRLADVVVNDGHVDYAILSAKSGLFAIKAHIFIDATGDGDLCVWAGSAYELGDAQGIPMPSTLCSLWTGVEPQLFRHRQDGPALEKAIGDGIFTQADRHLPGLQPSDIAHGIAGGNIGHVYGVDGTDEQSLTTAMVSARKTLTEYETYYRQYIPGGENATLCYTADMLGVRESRRIKGDYTLTGEDFRRRAVFTDEIGRYAYPVDIHAAAPNKDAYDAFEKEFETWRYGEGESYGIPYRILTPQGLSNVLVAGRCVSTDRQMQASIRVMPGCYITGQAAGIAAAIACSTQDTRRVPIDDLQSAIAAYGGYLPNR